MTIESKDAQTVYISVYTYDSQHIRNGACDNFSSNSQVTFTHERWNTRLNVLWGQNHADPVKMSAGEKFNIDVKAMWSDEDLMPHDFSVVVWAEKSPVKMVIAHGH